MADEAINDICLCGRLTTRVHCPVCGSYTVYATPSKMERVLDRETNQMRNVMVYRCRRCACQFNDNEWRINCQAPHIKRTRPMHDPADDIATHPVKTIADVPDHLRDALRKLQLERGIDPDETVK